MLKEFLLVGGYSDSAWSEILGSALSTIGQLDIVAQVASNEKLQQKRYDLIIVDAAGPKDIGELIVSFREQQPDIPIIVVTTSPTWQRARQVFLAGATDYLRKSLDKEALLETFKAILTKQR